MSEGFNIPTEFQSEWPDPKKLRHELIRLYAAQTNQTIDATNPTDAELEALAS